MNTVIRLMLSLVISYIITGVILMLLAFCMYKLGLGDRMMRLGVTIVYMLAPAAGGLFMCKGVGEKKPLWGFLVGCLYAAVICLVSIIMVGDAHLLVREGWTSLLLGLCGGTLGGMIS